MELPKYDLGTFIAEKNNTKIEYFIENITEDAKIDEAVQHMLDYFSPREPIMRHLGLYKLEEFNKELKAFWDKAFKKGNGIGAYLLENGSKGKLIGVNATCIVDKNHDKVEDGSSLNVILNLVTHAMEKADIIGHYRVDKFLDAYGLSVHPDFHGYQVGYRILESRETLCKLLGVRVTATFFSAAAAQHLALKLGFEVLFEIDYEDVEFGGEKPFKGLYEKWNEKKCMVGAKLFG